VPLRWITLGAMVSPLVKLVANARLVLWLVGMMAQGGAATCASRPCLSGRKCLVAGGGRAIGMTVATVMLR
jgi:hypothetical protein